MDLNGGAGADEFSFNDGATLIGSIDGGAGSDTLDLSAYNTGLSFSLTDAGSTDGYQGEIASGLDAILSGFDNIDGLIGSATTDDELNGLDVDADWLLGESGYQYQSTHSAVLHTLDFSGIEQLNGGSGADTFYFQDSAVFSGDLDGGAGTDTLDYSAYADAVVIDVADRYDFQYQRCLRKYRGHRRQQPNGRGQRVGRGRHLQRDGLPDRYG